MHIASIAGKEDNGGMLAYSALKAVLIAMAKVQGKEYAQTKITINTLAHAVIETVLVKAMLPEQVIYMTDKIPMKRCGHWKKLRTWMFLLYLRKTGLAQDLLLICQAAELRINFLSAGVYRGIAFISFEQKIIIWKKAKRISQKLWLVL